MVQVGRYYFLHLAFDLVGLVRAFAAEGADYFEGCRLAQEVLLILLEFLVDLVLLVSQRVLV